MIRGVRKAKAHHGGFRKSGTAEGEPCAVQREVLFRCPRRDRRGGGRIVLLRGELVDLCALLGELPLQPLDGRLIRARLGLG